MKIGSHVSMSAPEYVLGAVKEAISYGANAFMLYTGAPQNTRRKPMEELRIKEAHEIMKLHGIEKSSMIVHAPYIINLANCAKAETFELGVDFLAKEIERVKQLEASILVLHPGSHVKQGAEQGIIMIAELLNEILRPQQQTMVLLETMAGKGSEVGRNFTELRSIIDRVELQGKLGVCLDTCHVFDGGYDIVNDLENVLEEFDKIIGLKRLLAVHINDSLNILGSHKDRHAKIGQGNIGLEALSAVTNHPQLKDLPFYLETPNELPGYKVEIALLRSLYKW